MISGFTVMLILLALKMGEIYPSEKFVHIERLYGASAQKANIYII